MDNHLPIHDPDVALESTGGDTDLAQMLMDTCLEESPKIIQEAKDLISQGDLVGARRCGHSLKSSFGVVGAMVASAEAQKLEFTETDEPTELETAINSVEAAFNQLVKKVSK